MEKRVVLFAVVIAICAGCAGLMGNQTTPISPGLRTGDSVDISVIQEYTSLEDYVNQGVKVRVSNNTGITRDIEVTCRFLRGDRSFLSENIITVRDIPPFSSREDFVWSSRRSQWLRIVECATAPAPVAD